MHDEPTHTRTKEILINICRETLAEIDPYSYSWSVNLLMATTVDGALATLKLTLYLCFICPLSDLACRGSITFMKILMHLEATAQHYPNGSQSVRQGLSLMHTVTVG